jgi:hypothetical protein
MNFECNFDAQELLFPVKIFLIQCTGGPRYIRTFYLRIHLYAICKRGKIHYMRIFSFIVYNIILAQNNQIKKKSLQC